MKHPFITTPDKDAYLWRYMSLEKFKSLLETSSLYLCRVDLFDDPFEGSFSFFNDQEQFDKYYCPDNAPRDFCRQARERMRNQIKFIRYVTYVNCWHVSEYESAAMWQLYGKSVCIKTTFGKFEHEVLSFYKYMELSLVKYLDYRVEHIPEFNMMVPFVCKRKSFEHEKELRAIWQHPDGYDMPMNSSNNKGYLVKVDLNNLIEKIYVHPNCSDDFKKEVIELTRKHGLTTSLIVKSDMETEPFW